MELIQGQMGALVITTSRQPLTGQGIRSTERAGDVTVNARVQLRGIGSWGGSLILHDPGNGART